MKKYILNTDRQTRCVAGAGAHAQINAGAVKKSAPVPPRMSLNVYKNGEYIEF